jgi:hypothetical protein
MTVFEKLGLPATAKHAIRHTRIGDKLLDKSTRDTLVSEGPSFCSNGFEMIVQKDDPNKVRLASWTIDKGYHVRSFYCYVTLDGKLLKGGVNCFGMGHMKMDEDYLEEMWEELEESKITWDKIDS